MRANRRQLSLRQILFFTGLLSVIFTLAGPGKLPMSETLLLVASFGVAIGLRQPACLQLTVVRIGERALAGQVSMELNLSQFALTWIAVMMTTYVTLEAAIGTSFVYWIIPWEPFPVY